MYYLVYTEEYGYEMELYPYRYLAEAHMSQLRQHQAYKDVMILIHSIGHDELFVAVTK